MAVNVTTLDWLNELTQLVRLIVNERAVKIEDEFDNRCLFVFSYQLTDCCDESQTAPSGFSLHVGPCGTLCLAFLTNDFNIIICQLKHILISKATVKVP